MIPLESRSDFVFRQKKGRTWQSQPIEVRLERWLKRVTKATAAYARPHRMEIRQKLATALGLPTRWVELRTDGTIWHESGVQIAPPVTEPRPE